MSVEEAKKDSSKSTAEGEWEMRDGKWYRRDYYAIKAGEQQKQTVKVKCPNCPTYQEKINVLLKERDDLQHLLSDRDRSIVELRLNLEKSEAASQIHKNKSDVLETSVFERDATIQELEMQLRDMLPANLLTQKDSLIFQLNAKVKSLVEELESKQFQADEKDRKMQVQFNDQESLIQQLRAEILFCKVNHHEHVISEVAVEKPKEIIPLPPVDVKWYYAVQDPAHVSLFRQDQRYRGGDVVVDALEGATVVNPDYYSQSERVPGNARLRIRVIDSASLPLPLSSVAGTEIFVRLRLGNATQFTQPRPLGPVMSSNSVSMSNGGGASWHQDFVFVELPLIPHPFCEGALASSFPLLVELICRTIGTAEESCIGSGTVELTDLVMSLTRAVIISLSKGGSLNVRIKALDFGLPNHDIASTSTTKSPSLQISGNGSQ